jgi:hypothetical protein
VIPRQSPDAKNKSPVLPSLMPGANPAPSEKMTLTDRLAIAMILLVAVAVTAVGWLSYRSLEQALLPGVLDRIETHSRLVAAELQSHVRGARADIATFQSLSSVEGMTRARLNGGIDPIDLTPEATWRDGCRFDGPLGSASSRPIHNSASSESKMAAAKSSASTARDQTGRSASFRIRN